MSFALLIIGEEFWSGGSKSTKKLNSLYNQDDNWYSPPRLLHFFQVFNLFQIFPKNAPKSVNFLLYVTHRGITIQRLMDGRVFFIPGVYLGPFRVILITNVSLIS